MGIQPETPVLGMEIVHWNALKSVLISATTGGIGQSASVGATKCAWRVIRFIAVSAERL